MGIFFFFLFTFIQVFDVLLNRDHVIVDQLDIYDKVGRGVAHDEVISFTVKNKKLYVSDQVSVIENGKLPVEFVKVDFFVILTPIFYD